MIIDIVFKLLACALVFIFAKNIADFIAEYTPANRIFRDANHPITYRILAILVALFTIVGPFVPYLLEKLI